MQALGIHFFNPVPVMPLVELIPAIQTSSDIVDRSRAFAQACGKEVTISKDVPGFVSNRLLMPFINEAVMALEKGIASKEDIDKTLRLGMNHPMGPLTLADFIGLDTCLSIMETLYRETSDSKYRPAVLLGRMVDAGWFGKKSGKVRMQFHLVHTNLDCFADAFALLLTLDSDRGSTTTRPSNCHSVSRRILLVIVQQSQSSKPSERNIRLIIFVNRMRHERNNDSNLSEQQRAKQSSSEGVCQHVVVLIKAALSASLPSCIRIRAWKRW